MGRPEASSISPDGAGFADVPMIRASHPAMQGHHQTVSQVRVACSLGRWAPVCSSRRTLHRGCNRRAVGHVCHLDTGFGDSLGDQRGLTLRAANDADRLKFVGQCQQFTESKLSSLSARPSHRHAAHHRSEHERCDRQHLPTRCGVCWRHRRARGPFLGTASVTRVVQKCTRASTVARIELLEF